MPQCTKCNQVNPHGVSVCLHCAATLDACCSVCGHLVAPDSKFCGQCGARVKDQAEEMPLSSSDPVAAPFPLPAQVPMVPANAHLISGERRDVTVLFVDGVNFTATSGAISNEEAFFLIDELMRLLVDIVHKYEGTIDKFTGDGLMALFGAPTAHEDDAQRAVYAALEMQATLEKRRQQTRDTSPIDFHIRIGIHTGSAIAGKLGSDAHREFTVIGDTVNLANRMESAAVPDTVLVSEATYQRTWPLFDYQEVSQLRLKGIDHLVKSYRPLRARVRPMRVRGLPGLDSPMVGRKRQLEIIQNTITKMCELGSSRLIYVSGGAGVGKSRLVREFLTATSPNTVKIVQGNCLAYARSVPMSIVRQLLRDLIGIVESDSDEAQREKIYIYLHQLGLDGSSTALYVLHVLGLTDADIPHEARLRIMDPTTLRRQTHTVLLQIVTREAERLPLVFILEDMHWSDAASLEFLTYLINSTVNLPITFVVITRDMEYLAQLQSGLNGFESPSDRMLEIVLKPLGQVEASQLVSNLTQQSEGISEALKELIAERAKGMPLYAEEIVRMLLEQEGIVWEGKRLLATHRAMELIQQVPTTVAGLVLARFDQLPMDARQTLQFASVLGQSFPTELLEAVTGTDRQILAGVLVLLTNHRFLTEAAYGNESGYRFRHDLILTTIYNTLLQRNRRRIHELVAELVEEGVAGYQGERIEMLAYHYSRSTNRTKAIQYLLEAAKSAASRSANDTAVQHYHQALDYLQEAGDDASPQNVEAVVGLSRAQKFTGALAEASRNLEQLINAQLKTDRSWSYTSLPHLVEAYRELADVRVREGALEEAIAYLDTALHLLDASGYDRQADLWALVMDRMAWIRFRQGALVEAYDIALEIVNDHKDLATRDPLLLASIHNTLGGICWQKGERSEASEHVQRCLELYESMDYLWGMANALSNLGILNFRMGRWQDTADSFERSYRIRQTIGDIQGEAINLANLGFLHMFMGNHQKAHQNLEASLVIRRRLHDTWGIAQSLVTLAQLAMVQGDTQQASEYIHVVSDLTDPLVGSDIHIQSQWITAQLEAAAGDLDTGKGTATRALAAAQKAGLTDEENDCLRVLGALCAQNAELKRSEDLLVQARDHSEQHRDPYRHALAHLELGNLYATWSQVDVGRAVQLRQQATEELERAGAILAPLGAQHDLAVVESKLSHLHSDRIVQLAAGDRYFAVALYLQIDMPAGTGEEVWFETTTTLVPQIMDTVHHAGGTIQKLQEGYLALFGVPVVREDDTRHTLETALALAQLMLHEGPFEELPLVFRMGVARGEVVAGSAASQAGEPRVLTGPPITRAQALAQAAPANSIWTEQSVRAAIEHVFDFKTIEHVFDFKTVEYHPAAEDGDATTVDMTTLDIVEVAGYQRQPDMQPSLTTRSIRLVGREAQLHAILDLITHSDGVGGFVLLEGAAGIGKSTVAHEAVARLQSTQVRVVSGRCTQHGTQQAYAVFSDLIRRKMGIRAGDRPQQLRERAELWCANLPADLNDTVPYLELLLGLRPQGLAGELISRLEPEQLRQQIFVAMRNLFKHAASTHPLLLLLDDIQWLDPISSQLLVFLASLADSLPVFFICTQRTGEAVGECDAFAMAQQLYPDRTHRLPLEPLSSAESALLLDEVLAGMEIPAATRSHILAQSQGNPYFLIEFVSMLCEKGYFAQNGQQDWTDIFANVDTPVSLQLLIRSRIDTLPKGPRQLLQAAAVLGGTLPPSLLHVVARHTNIRQSLEELARRSMLVPAAESDQWVFAHPLIERVAYDSMLKAQRRIYHRRAACAIEILWAGTEEERAEDLAYHYLQADEIRNAVPYMIIAGERARTRYANEAAVAYFEQAIKRAATLPDIDAQTRWRIAIGLSEVYRFTGRYDDAIALLQENLHLADNEELSAVRQAGLYRQLGLVAEKEGKLTLSASHYQTALAKLGTVEHRAMHEEAARIWCGIAWTEFLQGSFALARDAASTGLEHARKAHSLNDMATAENLLGGICWRQGELQCAREHTQRAMDLREEIGFTWGMAATRSNLGVLAAATGDWQQAKCYFETSLELRSAMGDMEGVAILYNNLGTLTCNMGELSLADQYFQKSLDIAIPHHIGYHIANALKGSAEVWLLYGDYQRAEEICARCRKQAQRVDALDLLGEIAIVEAKALLAQQHHAEAKEQAQHAIDVAAKVADARLQVLAWCTLAEIETAVDEVQIAQQALDRAWAALEHISDALVCAHVTFQAGRIWQAQGNLAQATDSFTTARTIYHDLGAEFYRNQLDKVVQSLAVTVGAPDSEPGHTRVQDNHIPDLGKESCHVD